MCTDYFTKVLEDDLKAVVKPQYVDQIPKAVKGPEKSVQALLKARAQMDNLDEILDVLGKKELKVPRWISLMMIRFEAST